MNKNIVKFNVTDGCQPTKYGGLIMVKAPFDFEVKQLQTVTIGMGVSLNVHSMIVESPMLKRDHVSLMSFGDVVNADQEITLTLNGGSDIGRHSLKYKRGDTLAFIVPFVDNFDLE